MRDSYGIGFEFVKEMFILKNHKMEKYHGHFKDGLNPGDYSDDTQMSLAVAELLVSGEEFNEFKLANKFVDAYNRDKIDGYAKGFQSLLDECESGQDLLYKIKNTSNRNGAAMRAVPLGYIKDKEELLLKAEINAKITHNTKEGIFSSKAVALMSNFFIYKKGKINQLKSYIEKELNVTIDGNKESRCKCDALETIDAVMTALINNDNLFDIVYSSVQKGGDTDNVTPIALGIAATSELYVKNLPSFMERDLRNNKYGKDYLIELDEKMSNFFNV